jgi:serine/threonine-protein kinase
MPFEVGQFASDYEIISILGKGGMGRVYRVRNVISNRIEAMKVLLADVAAEAELGDRFLGEIRTLARLDHPNIAKFHTAFKVENQLVMVMEYVEGVTLTDRAKQGSIPLDDLLSYVGQTLDALSFAHKNGIIHRDIKPSNIMITPHGVVKLMDFGIAKSTADQGLTRPGTTMGSMLYMSPEQVRGTSVDARSDIYSVGILLYELTAGKRPFEAENTFAILDAQLNTAPTPPIEVNPALPQPLNDIILTALNKEPMQRFQTADAFKNALETLRQRPAAAPTPKSPQSVVSDAVPRKGNRSLWMALGAVACVCVLAAGAFTLPRFFKSDAASKKPEAMQTALGQVASTQPATPQSEPLQTPQTTPPPDPGGQPQLSQPTQPEGKVVTPVKTKPLASQPGNTPVQQPVQQPIQQPSNDQPPDTGLLSTAAVSQQSAGPSQQDLEAADESLMKLNSRSQAVHATLDSLRSRQAAQGLSPSPEITSGASRMDNYLGAAQRALQARDLTSANKNMQRAEDELTKLEQKFGR